MERRIKETDILMQMVLIEQYKELYDITEVKLLDMGNYHPSLLYLKYNMKILNYIVSKHSDIYTIPKGFEEFIIPYFNNKLDK